MPPGHAGRWDAIRKEIEAADVGFLLLRVVALAGIPAWILFEEISPERAGAFYGIAAYFIAYCVFLYALLFLRPADKKTVYALSLSLDLSYVYLLIVNTGGFGSSFFVGFYLLTALHAFYYGHPAGMVAAAVCAFVYYLAGSRVSPVAWTDFLLRASFLFLIALPIGLMSGKMRRGQEKIESLNAELVSSLEELKRVQDHLIRAEKLSALGRLTSDVAHEIRNPLTVIGGFAKRLEKRLPEGTKEKEHAAAIVMEVARLERILRDILSFSRQAKEHILYVNLNDIIAESGKAFADICRERSVVLGTEPAPDLPECLVDRDQVRQAVDNLVMNAVEAMPGGGALRLATRTDEENGVRHAVIDVIDTGVGIPEGSLERIFEPFYSSRQTGQGTGLGLSIVKKIMEEHRGAIRVTSAPGRGATFSLHFPWLPAEESFEIQCWEAVGCGMDKAGSAERCPAYPRYGRICWAVAGTLSETKACGVMARKIGDCRKCAFYARVQKEAAGRRGPSGVSATVPEGTPNP